MKDDKVVIEDELRDQFTTFVIDQLQTDVLRTLESASVQTSMSDARKVQVFLCFEAWLIPEMKEQVKKALHNMNLISLCFSELYSETSSCGEEASEAIYALLSIFDDSGKYLELFNVILTKIKEGLPFLDRLLKENDVENVKGYMYIVDGLVRKIFREMIMRPDSDDVKLILQDIYLKIFKGSDVSLASSAAASLSSFLKRLSGEFDDDSDDFEEIDSVPVASATALAEMRKRFALTHMNIWKEIVETSLIQSRMEERHLRYFDTHSIGTDDDEREFEEKNNERRDIQSLLVRITNSIGFMAIFTWIALPLSSTLKSMEEEQKIHGSGNISIELLLRFEGELHCVLCVLRGKDIEGIGHNRSSSSITSDNEQIMKTGTQLLELLLKFEYNNLRVLYTAMKIFRKASAFFNRR
jgi:hypothetical protein